MLPGAVVELGREAVVVRSDAVRALSTAERVGQLDRARPVMLDAGIRGGPEGKP